MITDNGKAPSEVTGLDDRQAKSEIDVNASNAVEINGHLDGNGIYARYPGSCFSSCPYPGWVAPTLYSSILGSCSYSGFHLYCPDGPSKVHRNIDDIEGIEVILVKIEAPSTNFCAC